EQQRWYDDCDWRPSHHAGFTQPQRRELAAHWESVPLGSTPCDACVAPVRCRVAAISPGRNGVETASVRTGLESIAAISSRFSNFWNRPQTVVLAGKILSQLNNQFLMTVQGRLGNILHCCRLE